MKVAFDIGGVLSKFPETFRAMVAALISGGAEVLVLTDMHDRPAMLDMLGRNGVVPPVREADVHVADYARHGEACKAILVRDLGIDVLIDDHGGYLAWPWATPAPVRLLVTPDPRRPYYAPGWETGGAEGDFGRRAFLDEDDAAGEGVGR
jgi:hypothetical protein